MLLGVWGARAGEQLEGAVQQRGARLHRAGELGMCEQPHVVEGRWQAWLFGAPEDRGQITTRFGQSSYRELPAAFGRALTELGETACELLCGSFVVVVLDRERGRCTVKRDQLGAQPLVHTRLADGVLFATHECDLLEVLPSTPSPDRLALQQWIESGLTPPTRTLFEDIERLSAGHQLIFGDSSARVERWWNLHYSGTDDFPPAELGERLRDAAFAAVARATARSQRPVVKLSGGLDSACVAAGLAANGFADGRAFAIGGTFATHPDTDETELIEATAYQTHLPLEQIEFDPASSMLAPALAHISRWRLPPATPNLFVWQRVMARARELGADLMLDGEGGDELFGLAPYLIADMLRGGQLRTAWSLSGRIPGIGLDPSTRLRLRVLRHFGLSALVPSAARKGLQVFPTRRASDSIIPHEDARELAALALSAREDPRDGPLWWRYQAESLIDQRDALDVGGHFSREATDEKIERRHPFLFDLQLTETALRLAPRAQFDPIRDRPLLRDALSGAIPEAVRTRHAKSHFTPLLLAGIQNEEARLIDPLRRVDAPLRAYVATPALERKLAVAADGRSMLNALPLWRLAIANRWLGSEACEGS